MKRLLAFDLTKSIPDASRFYRTFFRIGDTTTEALAELMFDAFRGTVDHEGLSLIDEVAEVAKLTEGGYGALSEAYSAWLGPLDQPQAVLFVVENGKDELFVPYVAVARGSRRQGYASALIIHCLRLAALAGKRRVTLYVDETDRPAIALCEKIGFAEVYLLLPTA